MIRVLLADDHPIMLSGIQSVLRDTRYEVVATAVDGADVLELLPTTRPDLLILDVHMPRRSGIDVLRALRTRDDSRPVVLLTASLDDVSLMEAVQLGVNGIMLKDGAHELLLRCLDDVQNGKRWIDRVLLHRALDASMNEDESATARSKLTVREKAIASLVVQGLRNKTIGSELGLTEGTVKVYLHRIYGKLGLSSRTELVRHLSAHSHSSSTGG